MGGGEEGDHRTLVQWGRGCVWREEGAGGGGEEGGGGTGAVVVVH